MDEDLEKRFSLLRTYRRAMTGALERARSEGLIGSSLQATLTVYDPKGVLRGILVEDLGLEALAIVSKARLLSDPIPSGAFTSEECPEIGVLVGEAEEKAGKCARCWKILEEVGTHSAFKDLCFRCAEVVAQVSQKETGESHA